MTTLHFIDSGGDEQLVTASAFVLNGKTLLAVDESGAKHSVAVWVGNSWRTSGGQVKRMRFAAHDVLTVRFETDGYKGELSRCTELRLTGSRGHLPRLGDIAQLAEGLWQAEGRDALARLVVASLSHYMPASYRLAA